MTEETTETTQWHERTVERSLKAARQRAIVRGDRFIAAAVDLLRTTGKPDFTVQEVVDRSGMSLRSFYHHFATKDDLLLALMEETVRRYVASVRDALAEVEDPVDRFRILLTTMFGSPETDDPASRGLVLFQWHLADSRTDEFTATLAPQVALVTEILTEGVDAGRFRTDIPVPVLADLVSNTLAFALDLRILDIQLTEQAVSPDDLVRWCMSAVLVPGQDA
jgi:AcrR family transcriptional regulator